MLIGISGKINSGKDTVGKIIQYLSSVYLKKYYEGERRYNYEQYLNQSTPTNISPFQIKKFADTIKNMVCMLIGCTREQLEDHEFKNKELGQEWWYYKLPDNTRVNYLDCNNGELISRSKLIKPTPRLLLQLLGTDCGRDILHPNIWVNALFSKYKQSSLPDETAFIDDKEFIRRNSSNWIITDMRFPNEMEAVKKRGGITIRVNRNSIYKETDTQLSSDLPHPSETALDNANFDYTIDNNGTIEELIEKVREILIKEKIIGNG